MTGQGLLDRMEVVNAELQLQAGEANVAKGLIALNVAQDYFESLAAVRPRLLGGSIGTVVTAASTESTAFPSGTLRIDRLQLLNASSLPKRELRPLRRTGGHAGRGFWPFSAIIGDATGEPYAYWTDGSNIYWEPLPSGVHTVRWYGFATKADITAAGTFLYPDIVALPIAAFAARLLKGGVEDDVKELASLAHETFVPVLDALGAFQRDGASGLEYTDVHDA